MTKDGIFGESVKVSTNDLLDAFYASGCEVFHLMGGAPALYIDNWVDILKNLDKRFVFHSDLLLVEGLYKPGVLEELSRFTNSLYAVSIKGKDAKQFEKNTGVPFNEEMFWWNLNELLQSRVPFYVTFTGMSYEDTVEFRRKAKEYFPVSFEKMFKDCFRIDLVKYKALD